MRACGECGGNLDEVFRYCPWCAAPQRLKVVEFFLAHAGIGSDRGKALRVSRYFAAEPAGRHVRFSVWSESGEAEAAVSLDEREATRLGQFVLGGGGVSGPPSAEKGRPAAWGVMRRALQIAHRG